MLYAQSSFENAVNRCGDPKYKMDENFNYLDKCYEAYRDVYEIRDGIDFIVIGRRGHIDEGMIENLRPALLRIRPWSPLINDSWLLGAMHSGKSINFTLNLEGWENIENFWDGNAKDENGNSRPRPSGLGREFIGLTSSGYALLPTGYGEIDHEPYIATPESREARSVSFQKYYKARNSVWTQRDMQYRLNRAVRRAKGQRSSA